MEIGSSLGAEPAAATHVLYPVESRFPLTRRRPSTADESASDEVANGPHPFGLRFFASQTTPRAEPAFGYSDEQQVTVDDNGRPVVHGPNASWSQTTTGNLDGNEETKMDQDPDSN